MASFITMLFGWMPAPLSIICVGIVALFFLFTVLQLVRFIIDLIPFI